MIDRKWPKADSYFHVEHEFVINKIMIILTEAVKAISCDGQYRRDHFHKRFSITRVILVISFKRE
jgi:hypothetical protein